MTTIRKAGPKQPKAAKAGAAGTQSAAKSIGRRGKSETMTLAKAPTASALHLGTTKALAAVSHQNLTALLDTPASTIIKVASKAVVAGSSEMGLFLVRPATASAAKALSSFRVELHRSSREAQRERLREFRQDTTSELGEIRRWAKHVLSDNGAKVAKGLISAGMVMRLSQPEAAELRRDLKNVQVLENKPVPLISPTRRSAPTQHLPATAGWHLEAIGQLAARRDGSACSGRGVRIAVLDTGIELTHPELGGRVTEAWRIKKGAKEVNASAVIPDVQHFDTDGHGTHVAGLICGSTIGVAPEAQLTSVLMMPKGYATTFDFIRCLDWAADHPEISLVNFSAGEDPFNADMTPYVADLIRTGALPFFAVGNDGANKTSSPGNYVDGVSVGATNPPQGLTVSAFSGSAQQTHNQVIYSVPDLVAPGASMWSSYRGGGFAELDGTSMATPVACGIAACVLEKNQGLLSPLELFDLLRKSCLPLAGESVIRQGAGLLRIA